VKLSIVVPIFNEKNTIREIYEAIKEVERNKEIILVDDYSTDGTREIICSVTDCPIQTEENLVISFSDSRQRVITFVSENWEVL
jgi:cellulose synthase/poly-beta-1,6-N-acetylglucosamine synthase-like glycosyltransferase